MSNKKNCKTITIIDIPLPSEQLRLSALDSMAKIEVEEISQEGGHFSVNYRRC